VREGPNTRTTLALGGWGGVMGVLCINESGPILSL
jgi:hypothetical protein